MHEPSCPYCNKPAMLVTGKEIYPHRPGLAELFFWNCAPCGAHTGCYAVGDGTKPLGRLANAELRPVMADAQQAFDRLWQHGPHRTKARIDAYAWLATKLGIPVERCHIGDLDVEQCKLVSKFSKERLQPAATA